jgi:PAS domain S-box-containing protein
VPPTPTPDPPKRRLAVSIIVPVIALAVLLTALVLGHAGWIAHQHDTSQARQTALLVAHLVADAAETYRSPRALEDFIARLAGERLLKDIVVATADPLRVIVSAREQDNGRTLDAIADAGLAGHMRAVARGEVPAGLDQDLTGGRLFAQPIRLQAPAMGVENTVDAIIGIRLDPELFHGLERRFLAAFALWTTAAVGAVLLLFVWILRRRLLAPLAAIRSTVGQRRAGMRDVRIPPLRPDELGELAAAINDAIDFIDAREERIRRLAMIAQGTDNSVMVTTPDGVIEWTNDAFSRITGYSAEEARGRRPRDFLRAPGEDYSDAEQAWEAIRAGRRVTNEVRALRKDGRPVVASSEAYPILNEAGDVTSCVFISHDVTDSRATRQEIVSMVSRFQQELAYDLHDHVGGDLGGLSFRAKALASRLQRAGRSEAQQAEELHAALGTVANRARSLSRMLAPTSPEQGGLAAALARLCQSTSVYSSVEVVLRRSGRLPELEPWRTNHVYLIAQEALRNAVRHGRASRVHVTLVGREDRLLLTVTSLQGRWDPEVHRDGLGIRIIRYRARTLNSAVSLRVHRTGVTQLRLDVPADGNAAAPGAPGPV